MREEIIANLSSGIDASIVKELVETYEQLVAAYRKDNLETCLSATGRFVEHTLRAIEYVRTGEVLTEIKSVPKMLTAFENDTSISEALRLIIPRVAYGMTYTLRSKRDAIHVKEISPQRIDGALCTQAASWVISEFLRVFHTADETEIAKMMAALMRGYLPFVEEFGDEVIVTKNFPCEIELLLLLSHAQGDGMGRSTLGRASKFTASSVSKATKKLSSRRHIHRDNGGVFHITGPGEHVLSYHLAAL